jgi:hypothetical protein
MNARFSRPGGNLKFVHTSLLEIAYEDDGPRSRWLKVPSF